MIPSVPNAFEVARSFPFDLEMARRGLKTRSLLPLEAKEAEYLRDGAQTTTKAGAQVRVCGNIPSRLFIVDRRVAVVSKTRAGLRSVPEVLVTREDGMVSSFCTLFDALWESAEPIMCTESDGRAQLTKARAVSLMNALDGRLIQVLANLLVGEPDKEISRRLGINIRTVQRDIAKLNKHFGVSSRAVLVADISRTGIGPDSACFTDRTDVRF